MTDVFQGSDLNKIVNGMFTHMKMQIENAALANSRFVFDELEEVPTSPYQIWYQERVE